MRTKFPEHGVSYIASFVVLLALALLPTFYQQPATASAQHSATAPTQQISLECGRVFHVTRIMDQCTGQYVNHYYTLFSPCRIQPYIYYVVEAGNVPEDLYRLHDAVIAPIDHSYYGITGNIVGRITGWSSAEVISWCDDNQAVCPSPPPPPPVPSCTQATPTSVPPSQATDTPVPPPPGQRTPVAPSNLRVVRATSDSITLNWQDNSNNETGFVIYRWNGSVFDIIGNTNANVTTFTDTGLQCATDYTYEVSASNDAGKSSRARAYATTDDCSSGQNKPAAPSNLRVVSTTSDSITLNWNDNSDNEQGFVVYRRNGSVYDIIGNTNANEKTFTNSGLQCATDYSYQVSAFNDAGKSSRASADGRTGDCSAPPPAGGKPAAPSNLRIASATADSITLNWDDKPNNERGFYIYRSEDGKSYTLIKDTNVNVTAFTDSGLKCATAYSYEVSAHNDAGESDRVRTDGKTSDCPAPTPTPLPKPLGIWQHDCALPEGYACLPIVLTIGDLSPQWKQEVRAAAEIWNTAGTRFHFTVVDSVPDETRKTTFTEKGLEDIKVARGEVRVIPASKVPQYDMGNIFAGYDLGKITFLRKNGSFEGALIVMRDRSMPNGLEWVYDGKDAFRKVDFRSVVAHELGHAAGLNHIPGGRGPIMYSFETDNSIQDGFAQQSLTDLDKAYLMQVYGPSSQDVRPDVPLLNAPANGEELNTIQAPFQWKVAPRTSDYYFQLSQSSAFISMVHSEKIQGTSLTVQLGTGIDYYWRVKATNSGKNSDWSEVRRVRVKQLGSFPDPGRLFPETKFGVSGVLWNAWQGGHSYNDSLYINGFPITSKRSEVNPTDGKTYQTQWFERTRFEEHPENQPPYNVLLGLLGTASAQRRQTEGPFRPIANSGGGLQWFPETKHSLGDNSEGGRAIAAFWTRLGGIKQFGFPLSQPFMETNQGNGKTYLVQYFERQRFEYHPENKGTRYEVLLGRLGAEQVNGSTASKGRWSIRLYNMDEEGEAFLNQLSVKKVGYREDSGWIDITDKMTSGDNTLQFKTYNATWGYAWGYAVRYNDKEVWKNEAGQAGFRGANDDDQSRPQQFVYDQTLILHSNGSVTEK